MNVINNRKFVTAWMTCDTVSDVARKLKLTNTQVSAKANSLRKKGVKLPAKHRGEASDSVEDLNAIGAKHTPIVYKPMVPKDSKNRFSKVK